MSFEISSSKMHTAARPSSHIARDTLAQRDDGGPAKDSFAIQLRWLSIRSSTEWIAGLGGARLARDSASPARLSTLERVEACRMAVWAAPVFVSPARREA